MRGALEDLLDAVERLDPDGRGRDEPVTDAEIDAAIAFARAVLAEAHAGAQPDPQLLAVRTHD